MRKIRVNAFVALSGILFLVACHNPESEVRSIDRARDKYECSAKGGLYFEGSYGNNTCFAIDSIIPLTGEREVNKLTNHMN